MSNKEKHSNLVIRYTEPSDAEPLKQWLAEPGILRWFPMGNAAEVAHNVSWWMGFCKLKASLTVLKDGEVVGISTLFLASYQKLLHQCQFVIIVKPGMRDQGVGSFLLNNIMHLAKHYHNIELLHLEVYEENPAISLYSRFGFKEFGRQNHWCKEEGRYRGRIFMERSL